MKWSGNRRESFEFERLSPITQYESSGILILANPGPGSAIAPPGSGCRGTIGIALAVALGGVDLPVHEIGRPARLTLHAPGGFLGGPLGLAKDLFGGQLLVADADRGR